MKKTAFILCLSFIFSTLAMSGAWAVEQRTINKAVDKPAPNFALKSLDGSTYDFKDHRGKPVLLIFTTTWCPYCKEEIPELKKMHEEYKGKLEVVAIYVKESPYKVQKFADRYKLPYTVLFDPLGQTAQSYFVMGVPTRVLVGADGEILCYRCRSFDELLQQAIKAPKK